MSRPDILVGVISDTHGLLRPEAISALRGSHLIIHAGDIGNPEIIDELGRIAPTFAVRGNVDTQTWARAFPATRAVEVGVRSLWVLHDIADLDLKAPQAQTAAVIYGHSHKPSIEWRGGVLYLNPGSAGPRRFRLPVTVARMWVSEHGLRPEMVELEV